MKTFLYTVLLMAKTMLLIGAFLPFVSQNCQFEYESSLVYYFFS